jgi:uncharacterized protein (DUF924 family)
MSALPAATTPSAVLKFWWDAGPQAWFRSDPAFDERVRAVLGPPSAEAVEGGLQDWEETPHGILALILLLDQVPRNIHRGTALAFAGDTRGLVLARKAIDAGYPDIFPRDVRAFFFLPLEHAEDMAAQDEAVDLFRVHSNQEGFLYALIHMDAIRRFGRFPHRNAILGRTSTPEEEAYLASGGFRG